MKITLIASDENSAPLYRVRALARLLCARFEVEVLGFISRKEQLDPDAPRDFPYRPVLVPAHARGWQQGEAELRSHITGDLLYAMKPRPSSFGVALRHRAATGMPVVVDIDDAELAMIHPWSKYPLKNMLYALPRLHQPNNYIATWALQYAVPQADGITVVSRHFQRQHGGLLVPQYVDTRAYDPENHTPAILRDALGLQNTRVVVFAGIAHPSKGVSDLVTALQRLPAHLQNWCLLVVGPVTPHAQAAAAQDTRVRLLGTQPPSDTPKFLALADLVVLPQRPTPAAIGQMPMKLFEALAMGVPVIATALSDIPDVLKGCGQVVPPKDVRALCDAIASLFSRPDYARQLGQAARSKVLQEFSFVQGTARLGDYLLDIAARKKQRSISSKQPKAV
jgi:glycosyltransferase involved in cell wall biosynthesis